MDPLRQQDIQRARDTPPEVKLMETLRLMEAAFELKRVQLRHRNPEADEAWIEEALVQWVLNRE